MALQILPTEVRGVGRPLECSEGVGAREPSRVGNEMRRITFGPQAFIPTSGREEAKVGGTPVRFPLPSPSLPRRASESLAWGFSRAASKQAWPVCRRGPPGRMIFQPPSPQQLSTVSHVRPSRSCAAATPPPPCSSSIHLVRCACLGSHHTPSPAKRSAGRKGRGR